MEVLVQKQRPVRSLPHSLGQESASRMSHSCSCTTCERQKRMSDPVSLFKLTRCGLFLTEGGPVLWLPLEIP